MNTLLFCKSVNLKIMYKLDVKTIKFDNNILIL